MLEDDATGLGHVQQHAGRVRTFAGNDDGDRGLADVTVDQLQQLLEIVGVSGCGVEEQHPGGPGVVVDPAGAGRGHVSVVSLRPVDRGHRGGEDLRGRRRRGRPGRVVVDPLVHGDGLLGHADAVDLDAARPRVDGQLSSEVAGEVAAVGGVAADGQRGQLLAVQQPGLAGVAHADGGQQRVGRLDVAGVGAEVLHRGVRADVPVGLVGAAHPGTRDGGRGAQVQRQLALPELDGRQRRHRGALGSDRGRETPQGLVGELHSGGRCGTGRVQRHLHRRQLGRRGGDRSTRRPVPVGGAPTGPQSHQQCPGQQHAPAGETGEDPGRLEDRVVGVVDVVDVGGRRRRLLGLRELGRGGLRGLGLGDRRSLLGRRVGRLLLGLGLGGGLGLVLARLRLLLPVVVTGRCLGSGDVELPADVDHVGVGEVGAAGLGDASGGVVDLRPPVGVAELVVGDVAECVVGLHGVGVRRRSTGRGRQLEHPAGHEEAGPGAQEVAVEFGDLLVARAVTEVVLSDRPQALPRLDRVIDRRPLLLRLDLHPVLDGRLVDGPGLGMAHRRRRGRGGRAGVRCLRSDRRCDE